LIGVAKTPASGGDISVENCQVKALEELEQYMEQHPELTEEDAALQLMFGNINGMASDELKAETQPDNLTIGNATTAPYYNVAFVHNGHGEAAATQSVLFGKTAEEPTAPEEEGWVFEGWFADKELTTPYDFTTPITKDITLYAKWTEVIVEPEPDEEEPEEPRPSLPTIVRGDKAEQVTDAAGNALGAYLDMTAEELAEAVFTSADPRPNRKVRLAVVDAANSLNAAQRNALEEAALGDVIVSYLDITLFKQAGSGREQQVTGTNAPIRITLQVPAWAINHDPAVSRMYYMLHWHDGEVERIYGDFDPAAGTFTFETECFSPYALCYTDVTTLGVPKTGTGIGLFAGGALLLAAGLCLLRARKKKA